MQITILFNRKVNEVPPRCSKARMVTYGDGEIVVTLQSASSAAAPVALVSTQPQSEPLEYRYFAGLLWVKAQDVEIAPSYDLRTTVQGNFAQALDHITQRPQTADQAKENVEDYLSDYLLVDGQVHMPAHEPYYQSITFGLGGNHGSTSLWLDELSFDPTGTRFNILDLAAAEQYAEFVAAGRGQSGKASTNISTQFQVLMPEVLKYPRRKFLDEDFNPVDRAGLSLLRAFPAYKRHFAGVLSDYYTQRAEQIRTEFEVLGWKASAQGDQFTHPDNSEVIISMAVQENASMVYSLSITLNLRDELSDAVVEYAFINDLVDAAPATIVNAAHIQAVAPY